MKNVLKALGTAAIMISLAGCGSTTPAAINLSDAQAVAQTFADEGFKIEDVVNKENEAVFNVVNDEGGAKVHVYRYDDLNEAIDGWDTIKATLTQSDYYMLNEKENGMGSVAVFNNSVNYNNAVVAFDAGDQMVIVVREISEVNMDGMYDVLEAYGYNLR